MADSSSYSMKPESESKVAAMFDRIAPTYDFLNRFLSAGQDGRWRRALVEEMVAGLEAGRPGKPPVGAEPKFLDVATGTGDVILAALTLRPGLCATGVDISREMLNLAAAKLADRHLAAADLQQMSMEALRFPDGAFDAVTVSFGLRNVVDKAKGIAEAFRVLRPGGSFLVLEFFLPGRGPLAWLFQFYFRRILPRVAALWSDPGAYSYLPASVAGFYSPAELETALRGAGFLEISQRTFLMGGVRLVRARK